MFERFTEEARAVVADATEIARERAVLRVEAEHLLLAITRGENATAAIMERFGGLDHETLSEALATESERSLAAVGVTAETPHFSPYTGSPKLATSAKVALEQSLRMAVARRDKHIGAVHLALATLKPDHGTVPRALSIAGVDRSTLQYALTLT